MPSPTEKLAITATRVVTPSGVLQGATLLTSGRHIKSIQSAAGAALDPGTTHLTFENATLLPGFIDLHVHGGGGWRVGVDSHLLGQPAQDSDPLIELSRFMASTGVSAFLPTLSTASRDDMLTTVRQVRRLVGADLPGADVLGTHLEGPYLNVNRKGAQREDLIRAPDLQEFEQVWEAAGGTVRYVTLAPELPGATQFIERLTALGVHVSAGHTDALAHEMQDAYAAGLKGVTHLFNAMRGVHHREAGVAGWSLAHGPSWAELIGDGVHVNPTVMRLAIRAKGAERVAIITDAGAFTGLPNGLYHEGYRTVSVLDGVCTL
ncbi:MAG: amidohydrolase family protein, partial [Trueperaceae bacterium]